MTDRTQLYLGGHWTESASEKPLEIRSPHDQSRVGLAAQAGPADIDVAVAAAREAFDHGPWPRLSPAERIAVIERFDDLHAARASEIAELVTAENGSARWFTQALQESLRAQTAAFVRAAKNLAWEQTIDGPSSPRPQLVVREPLGVVAAIIPWNAPHQSALAKMIPALLAGNTVILKASPETSLDAYVLAEVFDAAGFPQGVVSVVAAGRETSEYLVAHPGVDKIAFTGSTAAGRRIASIAGEQLKHVSLELGGKSASIILDDADLEQAVGGIRYASFGNNGEACIAHTRILAPRSRYDEIVAALGALAESITIGDPADPGTFVGPMVRKDQQERVRSYIQLGIDEGARLVTGGLDIPDELANGNYVRPTVFADADNSMRIAQEEIFGPVIVVIPYEDDDDAIRIANDSPYGLSGGVWTSDTGRGLNIARQVRTGTFSLSGMPTSYDVPFGGYKASGLGREFADAGLGQYLQYKSIAL